MPKTASPTKPAPTPAQTISERVLSERRQLLEQADEILLDAARRGSLSFEGRSILRSLNWDDRRINRELGRAEGVIRFQAQAGNASDREAAERKARAAERKRDEEAPKLREQITDLERQVAELERTAAEARRQSDARHQALEQLRKLPPEHVEERYRDLTRSIRDDLNPERLHLRGRIRLAEALARLDVSSEDGREQAISHCETARPEALERTVSGKEGDPRRTMTVRLNAAEWTRYMEELARERAESLPRYEELEKLYGERTAMAERILDVYAQ